MSAPWFAALLALGVAGLVLWYFIRRRVSALSRPPAVEFQGAIRAIREGLHPGFEKLLVDIPGLPKPQPAPEQEDEKTQPGVKPAMPELKTSAPNVDAEAEAPAKTDYGLPPANIFREYDIRGVVDTELTEKAARWIGSAIGTEIHRQERATVMIGRDARISSMRLSKSLAKGLMLSGVNIINLGKVATPMLYFAQNKEEVPDGVMLTASHNGPEYNGMKIVVGGKPLHGEQIRALHKRIHDGDIHRAHRVGNLRNMKIFDKYAQDILDNCERVEHGLKVVVDCANGMAGPYLPFILRKLGHTVEELYCNVDGNFPNHLPDPTKEENLEALAAKVQEQQADIGLALDGDADRLVALDVDGTPVWPDRLMMLFVRDLLERKPGATIVYDVKCSRHLPRLIAELGGKPVMSPCGHSIVRNRMDELDALLGGEFSGHIFFRENRYGFDDAMYAACRLLELLAHTGKRPTEVFSALPPTHAGPELRVEMPSAEAVALIQRMAEDYADAVRIDGLRVEYPDRWGVVRSSNTSPMLSMRFEGDTPEALKNIQEEFRVKLNQYAPNLELPF